MCQNGLQLTRARSLLLVHPSIREILLRACPRSWFLNLDREDKAWKGSRITSALPTTQDLAVRRAGRPELPLSEVHCSGHFQSLRRIVRGLDPVHLLKARENAAGSENPTR
jgi:hypothetical protein